MSNVAKLKKKAAEFEQKKQFDKALQLYIQILDGHDADDPDVDVGLYNRVGDLLVRQGSVGDAVGYYEKAVDLYAEGGFFNNAIALCNKILRQSPGRASIYYKLGKISAKKGFKSDARQNFLEYADRMQKAGQLDEAFRALKEFADLCPDQDDIRLMLAEQLAKRERKTEALEQLHQLYERFEEQGRDVEARATLDRMKAIDPDAQPPRTASAPKSQKSSDLVFLDVDFGDAPPTRKAPRPTVKLAPPAEEEIVRPGAKSPVDDLPLIDMGSDPVPPARFDAIELPVSMDVAAPRNEHDLALPGELPMIGDMPDLDADMGLELDMSGMDGADGALDDLVPPIGRATGAQRAVAADDFGLEIEHTASPQGLDAGAVAPMELDLVPTSFGDDFAPPSSRRVSGLESTIVDEDDIVPLDAMTTDRPVDDLPMLDAMDGTDDGFLLIDDGTDGLGGDLPLIEPDAPSAGSRPTVVLTPAELAAIDAAARGEMLPIAGSSFDVADGMAPLDTLEIGDDDPASGGDELPLILPDTPMVVDADAESTLLADEPVEDFGAVVEQETDQAAVLAARLLAAPEDAALRREYAEALLHRGEREAGLEQLEQAMIGFERIGDLDGARGVADTVIRVDPNSVRHHQKRVEYAFRTADRKRLVEAYLELGDALFRTGQPDKARVVYSRVLELAPDDARATAAIGTIGAEVEVPVRKEPAPRASTSVASRRYTGDASRIATPAQSAPPAPRDSGEFVNLGDLLRDDEPSKSTRMVVAEQEPTGDEQADFADMLRKFKQGVSENVDEEDYDSHYDLGVAYKEMGLLDEAIAEFQKALRATERRVRTYEALGQCFIEKKQWQVASTILQRALAEPGQGDEQLVGVLYLLGYASEALQRPADALAYYQRVFAVDIQFRDVTERLTAVEKAAR